MSRLPALEDRVPPGMAVAVAIVAVSTSAILVRWSEAPSPVKAFYRVLFTTVVLLPVGLGRNAGDFLELDRADLGISAVSGAALAVHFGAWFESLAWTSVAASVTLVQAQPLFVALGAWALLDERVTPRMVGGIVVAIAGMAILTLGDAVSGVGLTGERPLYGNGLAVLGAVAAAVYFLAGRSVRQRVALLPYVVVVYSVCSAVLLGVLLGAGHPLFDYPPREWLLFTGMALGPGLFGHTVLNWALAHLESSVVSVSLLGEPVGSTLLAVLLLGEVPTPVTVLGGAIVLAGIYVTAVDRERA